MFCFHVVELFLVELKKRTLQRLTIYSRSVNSSVLLSCLLKAAVVTFAGLAALYEKKKVRCQCCHHTVRQINTLKCLREVVKGGSSTLKSSALIHSTLHIQYCRLQSSILLRKFYIIKHCIQQYIYTIYYIYNIYIHHFTQCRENSKLWIPSKTNINNYIFLVIQKYPFTCAEYIDYPRSCLPITCFWRGGGVHFCPFLSLSFIQCTLLQMNSCLPKQLLPGSWITDEENSCYPLSSLPDNFWYRSIIFSAYALMLILIKPK